jgi:hypothetical protein
MLRTKYAQLALVMLVPMALVMTSMGKAKSSGVGSEEPPKQEAAISTIFLSVVMMNVPTSTPSVNCTSLGSTWTGGVAFMTARGVYDVSGCTRPTSGIKAETVKPAARDANQWSGARCNDGTPFSISMQLSPFGASNDWVVFLQGGAFCDDNVGLCSARDHSLTTTSPQPDRALTNLQASSGIFSRNANTNPALYTANFVYAMYCSSDAWSGATTVRRPTTGSPNGWYFSGRINVHALFEILAQRYGLDDTNPATRVLFAGESAGAAGVQTNADLAVDVLPNTAQNGRLKLVGDAGFLVPFEYPNYPPGNSTMTLEETLKQGYGFWGAQTLQLCEQAQIQAGEHPGKCFFSGVNYQYISEAPPQGLGLPVLQATSSIDSFYLQVFHIDTNNPADLPALNSWRTLVLNTMTGMDWVFSGGDHAYHVILIPGESWSYGPPGDSFREVLGRFWQGMTPERVIFGNP